VSIEGRGIRPHPHLPGYVEPVSYHVVPQPDALGACGLCSYVLDAPSLPNAVATHAHPLCLVCAAREPLLRGWVTWVVLVLLGLGQARALVGGELGAPSSQPFGFARHTYSEVMRPPPAVLCNILFKKSSIKYLGCQRVYTVLLGPGAKEVG
jgi:hypothetical protein